MSAFRSNYTLFFGYGHVNLDSGLVLNICQNEFEELLAASVSWQGHLHVLGFLLTNELQTSDTGNWHVMYLGLLGTLDFAFFRA